MDHFMTAATCPSLPAYVPEQTTETRLSVEIIRCFDKARPLIERLSLAGMATPYQSAAFIGEYSATVDAPLGRRFVCIALKDGQGEVQLLLPLSLKRIGPVTVAEFVGGKHSNYNLPLLGSGAGHLTAASLKAALTEAGRKAGIDAYALVNQPERWEGTANPLRLLGGQPSPSNGYRLTLDPDGERLINARLSKDALRKLRQKQSRLATLGAVSHRRAETDAEAHRLMQTFFRLKAASFKIKGITDPFESETVRSFLERGCTLRPGETRPMIEMHGLYVDDRPVAIFGGLADHRRFCGLIVAFDPDPEIARNSPGELLLISLIRQCCERGLASFDLGVGEARYKDRFCDEADVLFDTVLPVTAAGWMVGRAQAYYQQVKRWAKQSALGQSLIARFRKVRAFSSEVDSGSR